MKITLSKIGAAQAGRIQSNEKPFPYILNIPIQGKGTGNVEALSSYLCRQAELLSEWSHAYTSRLLESALPKEELPKAKKFPSGSLHSCNGIGIMEKRIAKAISISSEGKIDAAQMTLRPIKYLTDSLSHGLLRDSMCWCPSCWRDDVDKNETPYVRLYWTLQQVSVCAIHNTKLIHLCPACQEPKPIFPRFPRQHICDNCGHELYKTTSKHSADNYTTMEAWYSHSIYSLIERLSSRQFTISQETVSRAIRRLLNTHKMDTKSFANLLNIEPRMISGIVNKTRRFYFPAFMDLCHRLDIPPDHLLFDKDILSNPDNWRLGSSPTYVTMSKLSPMKKQKIHIDVKKALALKTNPPPRVSHIATKYGIQPSTIRYNFPKEYAELRRRWSSWDREFRKESHQYRIEKLTEGIYSLARNGIYPSERKLQDLGYVTSWELRRDDLKHILQSFQEVYKSLGFLDD